MTMHEKEDLLERSVAATVTLHLDRRDGATVQFHLRGRSHWQVVEVLYSKLASQSRRRQRRCHKRSMGGTI